MGDRSAQRKKSIGRCWENQKPFEASASILGSQTASTHSFFSSRCICKAGFDDARKRFIVSCELKQALTQANLSFELLLLAGLISNTSFENEKLNTILREEQNAVIRRADLFIPAVLKDQETRFQQPNQSFSRCQKSPWDQVIPLFDNGYVAATEGAKLFVESSLDRHKIAAEQERTLDSWQQAVNLMMSPAKTSSMPSPATPKNLAETLRQIQEMYLEDQAHPEPIMHERHTW